MMSEDVLHQRRQWCSICETTNHDECEPFDVDLRYDCMVCLDPIELDVEIEMDGWAYVHPQCVEAWKTTYKRSQA